MIDILDSYQAWRQQNNVRMHELLSRSVSALVAAMESHNLSKVSADYSGSNDSSDGIGFMSAWDENGKMTQGAHGFTVIEPLMSDVIDALTGIYYLGYENNEGGRGTVTVDLLAREVRIEHFYLGIECDTTEYLITAEEDEDLAALLQEHTPAELNEQTRYAYMRFEGYGDSGQMEECDPAAQPFEDWGYTVLENKLPGWEINNGGGAEFMIDFQERRVQASIWSNIEEECDSSVHTLSFDEVLNRAPTNEDQAA